MISGLLPALAADFDVSVPRAGSLISVFALSVAVGAPLITVATRRAPRKAALLCLLGVFCAGEILAAVAPTFGLLMAGRVVTGVAHGTVFGIGAVVRPPSSRRSARPARWPSSSEA